MAGWIADMEEVWIILGLSPGACPKCLATHANLDSPCEQGACTSQWILDTLAMVHQFVTRAKTFGLFGIEKLCWEGLGVDMC